MHSHISLFFFFNWKSQCGLGLNQILYPNGPNSINLVSSDLHLLNLNEFKEARKSSMKPMMLVRYRN